MNISKISLHVGTILLIAYTLLGCSAVRETFQSQMEVPTLENQANRVAIGMAIVRENNIMIYKMPISCDALWPDQIASDMNKTQEKIVVAALNKDPYHSTAYYTNLIQRHRLGSSASMNLLGDYANITSMVLHRQIKPLTKEATYKMMILYGKDSANWPDLYDFGSDVDGFLEFQDGTIIQIEAISGDVYDSLGEAIIALSPVNMQKDLALARAEMVSEFDIVARLKYEKSELENRKDYNSSQEKLDAQNRISVLKTEIESGEEIVDEKEMIYFELLDQAVVALQSDINVDDKEYVGLARNINTVAQEIQVGSNQAYASFALASANIVTNKVVQNFDEELKSLAIARVNVPPRLQSKFNKRVNRLVKNSVYLLPNILVGSYYATKQSILASKYEDITDIILTAYEIKTKE